MNWKDIELSPDNTYYRYQGQALFGRVFIEALKFHAPGLAAVQDDTGGYHIDTQGQALYPQRYTRSFGYYGQRAAVQDGATWFHLDEQGQRVYPQAFSWCGNYQENRCTVRYPNGRYGHIDPQGQPLYAATYRYAGDYKDGIACVRLDSGLYKHIDNQGDFLHDQAFLDLGIFHKNFATAKDERGWFHLHKNGQAAYDQRYQAIEPFYNGIAVVDTFEGGKALIDEQGKTVLRL